MLKIYYYHQRLITDSLCYHYPLSNKLYNYDVLSYTLTLRKRKPAFLTFVHKHCTANKANASKQSKVFCVNVARYLLNGHSNTNQS